ncbi:3',5'-cyclic-nucleotide phosphodiesterase [Rhodovulum sp. P5]|uniref:phosphodiesterase n=1 Tax=Rhodovulum sp. P5 TaxID=1564506 RepID=UPI0009C31D5E|nr:phosphodiesterase [Rhodovulum sp. P5]ARE39027.1 3',5'-cyclic-nucleotide phosphodiesterase [Rhodovulum sp. P5]
MSDRLKLIVLSDLHLVPEGQLSHGLDTADRLRAGIAAINARHGDADCVVLAGDLADLGERAAYERLRDLLADLTVPSVVTIGNHDDRAAFLEVFGQDAAAATGFVDAVRDIRGQRLIVLDSEGGKDGAGRLEPIQLNWLRDRLAEAADRPVIVILHHHANPLSTAVDRIILENAKALVDVLKTHPDIRQVIAGHVHYTSTALWHGVPFTTLAGSHYNVTIPLAPGVAVHRLDGPAQMAVVLSDADQTLVHFDNYIDGHGVISVVAPKAAEKLAPVSG